MSLPREPLHQPPNPDDLRRLPPASPACAQVRGMLRDFADGDLSTTEVAHVENHLAGCRTCAVELARAEHEVLR
ncbi:MAG: zf-HC2 domain-containing protein, partial [Planctomycetota bacterium]